MKYVHVPVMLNEIIEGLNVQEGKKYIDCTLGGGGYSLELAKKIGKKGTLLSIDLDDLAIENFKKKMEELKISNVILEKNNFKNILEIVEERFEEGTKFAGIVFDLGLSSAQLDDESRGFSFQKDTPLNMAFSGEGNSTVRIVNNYSRDDLFRIFKEYGEERFSRKIADKIVEYRKKEKIKTTGQLLEIVDSIIKPSRGNIHPATRIFQALRIETNQELNNLKYALESALKLLEKGGRIVVVSFHSLEDRIVKNFFRGESKDCICPPSFPICTCDHKAQLKVITKKIILPTEEETKNNPRSRSAKLRIAEKI